MTRARVVLFLLAGGGAWAQDGAIAGRIVDDFGGPVAGASVIAKNSSGQEFKATALAGGDYTLGKLAPGAYQITATMATMKKFEQKALAVEAAKTSRLDITLKPAGLGTLGEDDRFSAAYFDSLPKKATPVGPTPRLADGTPDLSGYWISGKGDSPEATPQETPAQPQPRAWAEAVRKERQASNFRDEPYARCLPG